MGSLAAKYFRQAAKWNGNEAYSRLHDGYVFSGPQTMALLLAELVNLRFKANESASGFCLCLREIFEDLEMVPGPSSITMNDTQKIGYLLTGIRQEKSLQAVYVSLQDKQLRGLPHLRKLVRIYTIVARRFAQTSHWRLLCASRVKKSYYRLMQSVKIKKIQKLRWLNVCRKTVLIWLSCTCLFVRCTTINAFPGNALKLNSKMVWAPRSLTRRPRRSTTHRKCPRIVFLFLNRLGLP
jgi:hypothetical protein